MKKRFILVGLLILIFSCAKKEEPYYMFHIGRDLVITDSTGKILKDTFYNRINLGYSYEYINGMDTVYVPKYVKTMDLARGIEIKMFSGMVAIEPKTLRLLMNYSPSKLTYMKGSFQLIPEDFVGLYKTENGYVIFTTMNIYQTDLDGREKKVIEVYTSKKYYGFYIEHVDRISPERFLLIGGDKFGIYDIRRDTLIVSKPKRHSSPVFMLNKSIYRLEATIFEPGKSRYVLLGYNYNGELVDSMNMPIFKDQYRIRPYVFKGSLYAMSENALYHLSAEDFSVLKKLDLPVEYDSLWNTQKGFIVYSKRKNQIAKIPKDLSSIQILAKDINCERVYASMSLIACQRGDSSYIYDLSFKPVSVYNNALFVKGDFIGTRVGDTLLVFRKGDTFLKVASPYYSYQKKLQEQEKGE